MRFYIYDISNQAHGLGWIYHICKNVDPKNKRTLEHVYMNKIKKR